MEKQESGIVTPPELKSIEECSHSHPYEYLTKLNQVFNGYNRSTVKDYSAASKIKLPFYKFNQMKVPSCFETSYAKERRELVNFDSMETGRHDDGDRKLWKDHKEIILNYLQNKKKKPTKQPRNKNKEEVEKIISKDRSNLFLKKIIEKGTTFDYDHDKLEQEVIAKLKSLNKPSSKGLLRCQTAKCLTNLDKGSREENSYQIPKVKVSETEYLLCENEQEMIVKYKSLMKKADFSISDKSIKKTSQLIGRMQKIVTENTYY